MIKFFEKNYLLLLIIFAAILFRILLGIILINPKFTSHDDLIRFQDWGRIAYNFGISETYNTTYLSFSSTPNTLPPGTVYIDLITYSVLKNVLNTNPENFPGIYGFFLKLPNMIADIFMGLMIFYIVLKNTKRKYALMATFIFLFNPIIIYNSTVWGQTDALINLLFLGAITALVAGKYFISTLLIFLTMFIKISLLPLLPLFLIIILIKMKFNYKKLIYLILISVVVLLILTLSITNNPFNWWTQFFMNNSKGELPYITNYAFNFWSMIFNPDSFSLVPVSSEVFYGLTLNVWGYIFFGIAYVPLLIYSFRQKNLDDSKVLIILSLAAFAVFLFLPRMHQRYIYPAIPLLSAYVFINRKNLYAFVLLILSLINFINLYVVWHPANFLPTIFTNIIIHSKVRLSMSIFSVVLFILMYASFFKENITKKHI